MLFFLRFLVVSMQLGFAMLEARRSFDLGRAERGSVVRLVVSARLTG